MPAMARGEDRPPAVRRMKPAPRAATARLSALRPSLAVLVNVRVHRLRDEVGVS